jgi:thiamine-phosphate pyrophosphorylase
MLPRQPSPSLKKNHHVPICWLMVDARLGDAIPAIVAAMPPRSAVVVRPYAMRAGNRIGLIRAVRRVARAKRHLLLIAGGWSDAGFDGRHGDGRQTKGFLSLSVHDRRELARANRLRADAVLLSPVWPTRTHPDGATLGKRGFARLAAGSSAQAIALGGVTARQFARLRVHGAGGWAAIDAWLPSNIQRP